VGKVIRGLLTQGNTKLGQSICHFDLPAGSTCPGQSEICASACYAKKGRYSFQSVQDRLDWSYQQSLREDFSQRMIAEIKRKGALVIRLHCSGDLYSAEYALKWLNVMRHCPKVRFYLYSRSWRIEDIGVVLEQMAALRCCKVWYSIDCETGIPASVPVGVRLAYLQVDKDEEPEWLDLLFVTRRLKTHAKRVSLPMLCPQQAGTSENCGDCKRCFS
jgi:Gene product 88